MPKATPRRPKLVLFQTKTVVVSKAAKSENDYAVYASYRPHHSGNFVGTLKVVRLTDGRLLYPFDGSDEIGPFSSASAARKAAEERAKEIIGADLRYPEL
ncbi:DUF6723 family protein [Caballeronia hypogeia]|uniref:DUF6723 family protein n=1 Tax=Caballeronia hypogeia TaxID=1777140 RepID=UPI000941917B